MSAPVHYDGKINGFVKLSLVTVVVYSYSNIYFVCGSLLNMNL